MQEISRDLRRLSERMQQIVRDAPDQQRALHERLGETLLDDVRHRAPISAKGHDLGHGEYHERGTLRRCVDPSRTATVLTSHAQLCERVLFPAPAGNVPGCRGAGPGVGEPLSLFSMESPAGHSLEQNADPHSPSFAMLCLSKVSRLLPSTLAQS